MIQLLRDVGAITSGHFLLSSGRHSDVYAEKFRALERPDVAKRLGEAIADRFAGERIDVVLAPAVGAIVLGTYTALALGARSIFAERQDGRMTLRRGFHIGPDERVLVVEDVITTGGSVKEVIDLVPRDQLVGVGALLDRSGGVDLGTRFEPLATMSAESWEASDCPMCARGDPVTSPGSHFIGGAKTG